MKLYLLSALLLLSCLAFAQPGHWRVGVQIGTATVDNTLITSPTIPDNRLSMLSPAGAAIRATIERSLTPYLSVRVGLGSTAAGMGFKTSNEFRDSTGRLLFSTRGQSGSTSGLTTASTGLTFNSRAFGRLMFTSGIDALVRINNRNSDGGRVSGGSSGTSFTTSTGQQGSSEFVYRFTSASIAPVTMGLALRVGLDYRLSTRGVFSLEAAYNHGFGLTRKATATELRVDGVAYQGEYSSRGSGVQVMIGYKHSLFRVSPFAKLPFTPYNEPRSETSGRLTPDQRARMFQRGTWQYELRGEYWGDPDEGESSVGGTAGYFFANRHMVGLSVDYRSYGSPYSDQALAQLVQVGPFIRTYALRRRVSPYLDFGYQIGRIWSPSPSRFGSTQTIQSRSLGLGFSIRVNESLRVNPSYLLQWFSNTRDFVHGQSQLSLSYTPRRSL